MFLNYFALGLLFFVVITLFYAVIAIHDVPYEIARRRQHPHQDAIHAAGWVSLFTLHALWPFLWIWAMAYRPERGWGFRDQPPGQSAGRISGSARPVGGAHRSPRETGQRGASLMEILLLSIYGALCWIIFKVFHIPLNKWTLPTAVLGGIAGLFFILLIMNYNHPFTKEARIYFYTTPIVPVVRGPVIEVPVQPNKPLKKGDVLFRIDPRPYEYALQQKRAALAEAEQTVKQLGAAAEAAQAKANEEIASRDRAKQSFGRYQAGNDGARAAGRPLPYSELQVENQRGIYLASEASVANAQATAAQAQLAYQSNIDGVNTTVARLQAEVQQAQYDLDQTVFRAPTDGYVTHCFCAPA